MGLKQEFDNLENVCQLHEEIRIIYVVDGYEAQLNTLDGQREVLTEKGDTIQEALMKLNDKMKNVTLEQIRRGT